LRCGSSEHTKVVVVVDVDDVVVVGFVRVVMSLNFTFTPIVVYLGECLVRYMACDVGVFLHIELLLDFQIGGANRVFGQNLGGWFIESHHNPKTNTTEVVVLEASWRLHHRAWRSSWTSGGCGGGGGVRKRDFTAPWDQQLRQLSDHGSGPLPQHDESGRVGIERKWEWCGGLVCL